MATFETTTKSSSSLWKSPDGQREIFEVVLDYNGQEVKGKSYSKDIAQVGWSGTVETYDKEGRNGKEVFVKQAMKAGYGGGGGGGGYQKSGGKPMADPFTMYLSYAKDLAISCVTDKGFNEELFAQLLDAVKLGGNVLYESRPDAPEAKVETKVEAAPAKEVRDDTYIDWSTIDNIFPENEK